MARNDEEMVALEELERELALDMAEIEEGDKAVRARMEELRNDTEVDSEVRGVMLEYGQKVMDINREAIKRNRAVINSARRTCKICPKSVKV